MAESDFTGWTFEILGPPPEIAGFALWAPIPGFEDKYLASSLGQIYSIPRKGSDGRRVRGRMLKQKPDRYGYRRVVLYGRTRKYRHVHALVVAAFEGSCPVGLEVRHMDGKPNNNRLTNLQYSTHSVNMRDKHINGTNHQVNKTCCPAGHLYDEENTYLRPNGGRGCRACVREAQRRYRRRLAANILIA